MSISSTSYRPRQLFPQPGNRLDDIDRADIPSDTWILVWCRARNVLLIVLRIESAGRPIDVKTNRRGDEVPDPGRSERRLEEREHPMRVTRSRHRADPGEEFPRVLFQHTREVWRVDIVIDDPHELRRGQHALLVELGDADRHVVR